MRTVWVPWKNRRKSPCKARCGSAGGRNGRLRSVFRLRSFYGALLGLDVAMDMGWIMTFASDTAATPQISVATEGGSGTAVPDLSIEEIYKRARAARFEITYGIADEPWGVRRFYVRDPLGKIVNIAVFPT